MRFEVVLTLKILWKRRCRSRTEKAIMMEETVLDLGFRESWEAISMEQYRPILFSTLNKKIDLCTNDRVCRRCRRARTRSISIVHLPVTGLTLFQKDTTSRSLSSFVLLCAGTERTMKEILRILLSTCVLLSAIPGPLAPVAASTTTGGVADDVLVPATRFCTIATHSYFVELVALLLFLNVHHPYSSISILSDEKTRDMFHERFCARDLDGFPQHPCFDPDGKSHLTLSLGWLPALKTQRDEKFMRYFDTNATIHLEKRALHEERYQWRGGGDTRLGLKRKENNLVSFMDTALDVGGAEVSTTSTGRGVILNQDDGATDPDMDEPNVVLYRRRPDLFLERNTFWNNKMLIMRHALRQCYVRRRHARLVKRGERRGGRAGASRMGDKGGSSLRSRLATAFERSLDERTFDSLVAQTNLVVAEAFAAAEKDVDDVGGGEVHLSSAGGARPDSGTGVLQRDDAFFRRHGTKIGQALLSSDEDLLGCDVVYLDSDTWFLSPLLVPSAASAPRFAAQPLYKGIDSVVSPTLENPNYQGALVWASSLICIAFWEFENSRMCDRRELFADMRAIGRLEQVMAMAEQNDQEAEDYAANNNSPPSTSSSRSSTGARPAPRLPNSFPPTVHTDVDSNGIATRWFFRFAPNVLLHTGVLSSQQSSVNIDDKRTYSYLSDKMQIQFGPKPVFTDLEDNDFESDLFWSNLLNDAKRVEEGHRRVAVQAEEEEVVRARVMSTSDDDLQHIGSFTSETSVVQGDIITSQSLKGPHVCPFTLWDVMTSSMEGLPAVALPDSEIASLMTLLEGAAAELPESVSSAGNPPLEQATATDRRNSVREKLKPTLERAAITLHKLRVSCPRPLLYQSLPGPHRPTKEVAEVSMFHMHTAPSAVNVGVMNILSFALYLLIRVKRLRELSCVMLAMAIGMAIEPVSEFQNDWMDSRENMEQRNSSQSLFASLAKFPGQTRLDRVCLVGIQTDTWWERRRGALVALIHKSRSGGLAAQWSWSQRIMRPLIRAGCPVVDVLAHYPEAFVSWLGGTPLLFSLDTLIEKYGVGILKMVPVLRRDGMIYPTNALPISMDGFAVRKLSLAFSPCLPVESAGNDVEQQHVDDIQKLVDRLRVRSPELLTTPRYLVPSDLDGISQYTVVFQRTNDHTSHVVSRALSLHDNPWYLRFQQILSLFISEYSYYYGWSWTTQSSDFAS